jgi:hypothetical protein
MKQKSSHPPVGSTPHCTYGCYENSLWEFCDEKKQPGMRFELETGVRLRGRAN